MVMKPLMNMNTAQTGRSGRRCSRRLSLNRATKPRVTSASRRCNCLREPRSESAMMAVQAEEALSHSVTVPVSVA